MKSLLTIIAFLLLPCLVHAEDVNWPKGLITVKATAFAPADAPDAYSRAEDAARLEAFGLMLAAVKGVRVTRETTLDQFARKHKVEHRVEGLVSDVKSQGQTEFRKVGNNIEATLEMQICLHNATDECARQQSVLTLVQAVVPPVKPVLYEKPCEAALRNEFTDRPMDGIGSLTIVLAGIDEYVFNLSGVPFSVKFPDGKGGYCTLTSPGTLDAKPYEVLSKDGFKMIFMDSQSAQIVMEKQSIEVKAKAVTGKNEIIIEPEDGMYLNFIDKRSNNIFSRLGKVAIVTKNAVSK
ncbi:MAG: hypothetical protein ACOYL3_21560 [Desulfuromonadaceae bacterium]